MNALEEQLANVCAELGLVGARLHDLVDVVSGDFLAIPKRHIFDNARTIHGFEVTTLGRQFHSIKIDNTTDYPLYLNYASGRGGNAADYDAVIEPRTGAILTRPYEVVSYGFDAANRPAGAVAINSVFYARALPPARWALDAASAQTIDGVYNLAALALADGARAPLQLSSKGVLRAGAPVSATTGADGLGNAYNTLADSDANTLYVNIRSQLFNGATWDRQRTPLVFKAISNLAIAAETAIWTPGAGKKFRLMGYHLFTSAAVDVTFRDAVAGATIFRINVNAATPVVSPPLGNGYLSALANNALTAQAGAACNLFGWVFGTEE